MGPCCSHDRTNMTNFLRKSSQNCRISALDFTTLWKNGKLKTSRNDVVSHNCRAPLFSTHSWTFSNPSKVIRILFRCVYLRLEWKTVENQNFSQQPKPFGENEVRERRGVGAGKCKGKKILGYEIRREEIKRLFFIYFLLLLKFQNICGSFSLFFSLSRRSQQL